MRGRGDEDLEVAESIGKAIAERRAALGLSQVALARKLGVSASWIGLVETGRRHVQLAFAVAMAEVLGCDVADLVGESSEFPRQAGNTTLTTRKQGEA